MLEISKKSDFDTLLSKTGNVYSNTAFFSNKGISEYLKGKKPEIAYRGNPVFFNTYFQMLLLKNGIVYLVDYNQHGTSKQKLKLDVPVGLVIEKPLRSFPRHW